MMMLYRLARTKENLVNLHQGVPDPNHPRVCFTKNLGFELLMFYSTAPTLNIFLVFFFCLFRIFLCNLVFINCTLTSKIVSTLTSVQVTKIILKIEKLISSESDSNFLL